MNQIVYSHQETISQLSATYTAEKQQIKLELGAEIERLTAQHEAFIQEQNSQQQNQIMKLHTLIETLKSDHK